MTSLRICYRISIVAAETPLQRSNIAGGAVRQLVGLITRRSRFKSLPATMWRRSSVGWSIRFIPGESAVRTVRRYHFNRSEVGGRSQGKGCQAGLDPISDIRHLTSRWSISSAGRAPALQAGGHRSEPYCSHHYLSES